jgi:hypothetical protein
VERTPDHGRTLRVRAHETNAFRTSPLLLSVLSIMRWVGVPGGSWRPASPTSRARCGARTMTEGNTSAHFAEQPPFSFLLTVPARTCRGNGRHVDLRRNFRHVPWTCRSDRRQPAPSQPGTHRPAGPLPQPRDPAAAGTDRARGEGAMPVGLFARTCLAALRAHYTYNESQLVADGSESAAHGPSSSAAAPRAYPARRNATGGGASWRSPCRRTSPRAARRSWTLLIPWGMALAQTHVAAR